MDAQGIYLRELDFASLLRYYRMRSIQLRVWRNWQTRMVQVHVSSGS